MAHEWVARASVGLEAGGACQTSRVRNLWGLVVLLNAVVFTLYLQRQRYRRLWLAALAALLVGPLIWLWWAFLAWRGRRSATT